MIRRSRATQALLITGAGASYGMFPATHDVTEFLRQWSVYRSEPYISGQSYTLPQCHETRDPLYPDARTTFFERIFQSHPCNPECNFEDLLDIVDQEIAGTGARNEFPHQLGSDLLRQINLEARSAILNYLSHSIPEANLATAPLNRLLQRVHENYRTSLVTLNYDNLPELSPNVPPLDWGFGDHNGPMVDRFSFDDSFRPEWSTTGIRYLPVHGSIHYGLTKAPGIVWYRDVASAITSRTNLRGSMAVSVNSQGLFALFVAGRNKTQLITTQSPFNSYFGAMVEVAAECALWIIVGYSGADAHINGQLRHAVQARETHRRPLRIVICSPTAADLHNIYQAITARGRLYPYSRKWAKSAMTDVWTYEGTLESLLKDAQLTALLRSSPPKPGLGGLRACLRHYPG